MRRPNIRKMKTQTLTLILFLVGMAVEAQDLHLSNFQPAGMLTNPALTGSMPANYQLSFQYRSQWTAIPDQPYTTIGFGGEMKLKNLGLGAFLAKNHAGPASLSATNVMFAAAYHRQLGQRSFLSLGAAGGILQKSIIPNAFSYDNQYVEGEGFDPLLDSGEPFLQNRLTVSDFSVGLSAKTALSPSGNVGLVVGGSLAHLNAPNESFYGEVAALPMRTTLHAHLSFKTDELFFVEPHLLFLQQGQHRELLAGANFRMLIEPDFKVRLGLSSRFGDAIIGQVELELAGKSFWFSYDATVSGLRNANAGKGAWESGIYLRFGGRDEHKATDRDGDGILDSDDDCPDVPGVPQRKGCPLEYDLKNLTDTDHDGVPDTLDQCPLEPGLPCFYGCNDKDRDGTWDHLDACPSIFGPPENQGCPLKSKDSDLDGIPDAEDYCPYLKGLPQFHGCPDSDGDGISDIDDECPYMKGEKRWGGCPKGEEAKKEALPEVTVYFDHDQAVIKPQYRVLLMEFARSLPAEGSWRIVVAGHTDFEGTDDYNYELGRRRAQAVADFLLLRGVHSARMELMSYGEVMPAASNDTEAGKARNRRVEVVLLPQ